MGKREEAARAVCKLFNVDPDLSIGFGRTVWMGHLQTVDAVIVCIREPDEKMIEVGNDAIIVARSGSNEVWQAMIDAIGD